jgi:hypothetical protein
MPEIYIPKDVVAGFQSLIKLSKKSLDQITDYLNKASVSEDPNIFLKGLDEFIESNLRIKDSRFIVQAIGSFIDLLQEESHEKVSENLATSFKQLHSPDISEKDFQALKNNLEKILKSSHSLELSIKAYRLMRETSNIYQKSKILSDVRLIFEKQMENRNRKAVLVHNLHITYLNNSQNKDFFVALDLKDLKSMKDQIERALRKDEIIKNDYKDFDLI